MLNKINHDRRIVEIEGDGWEITSAGIADDNHVGITLRKIINVEIESSGQIVLQSVSVIDKTHVEVFFIETTQISEADALREKYGVGQEVPDSELFELREFLENETQEQEALQQAEEENARTEGLFIKDLKKELAKEGLSIDDLIKVAKAGKVKG